MELAEYSIKSSPTLLTQHKKNPDMPRRPSGTNFWWAVQELNL